MVRPLVWLAVPAGVFASAGRVLVFDSGRPEGQTGRVEGGGLSSASGAATANFIAHRLGLDRHRAVAAEDVDGTIGLIDRFGSWAETPLRTTGGDQSTKALIVVETVETAENLVKTDGTNGFEVANVDGSAGTDESPVSDRLLDWLKTQIRIEDGDGRRPGFADSALGDAIMAEFWDQPGSVVTGDGVYMVQLTGLTVAADESAKAYREAEVGLKKSLGRIVETVKDQPAHLTVVFLSGTVSSGRKRPSERKGAAVSAPVSIATSDKTAGVAGLSPLAITALPACFSSAEKCDAATSGCSDRGECGERAGRKGCFACVCARGPDGGWYGGKACQKKDISVEFWLFAGVSVVGAAILASALGLLYSLDGEELPKILSVGLPPKAQADGQ